MNPHENIHLTGEQETLLVPLYCKTSACDNILTDTKAREIVNSIAYDFASLRIPRKTCLMLCMRARQFDQYTRQYLNDHPDCTILHLGCGLDSRYFRLDSPAVPWFDLDLPAVITLRRKFYQESDNYHMIASSVTEPDWLQQVLSNAKSVLILAEGLFMYLTEADVKTLVQAIAKSFSHGALVFDAFSSLTARHAKSHPSLHHAGAKTQWGLDEPQRIEQWADSLHFQEEWSFTQSEQLDNLRLRDRIPFKIAHVFPVARRAHRILYYTF